MKEEILQKSLQYFLKHGIREMSNNKLVELLGISTKTLYKYFKNKEDLLDEVLQLHYEERLQQLKNLPLENGAAPLFYDLWQWAIEREYSVNNAFYEDLRYYYPELERKIEAVVNKQYAKEFLRIMQKGIEEGSFREDIVPEVFLEGIRVLFQAITRTDQFKQFRLPADKILLNTIAPAIKGICTRQGEEALEKHIQNRQPVKKNKNANKTASANLS